MTTMSACLSLKDSLRCARIERIIREIRRRTRVVGAFPNGHSALMLVAARLRHIASTKWGKRRYLAMETLLHPVQQAAAA
jgi:transposase-like protein